LDFLALNAILFCLLRNRFCSTDLAVAASKHLYGILEYL
jgi:hypothetical protein